MNSTTHSGWISPFVASANENSDGFGVCTLLNHKDPVSRCPKGEFTDKTSSPELGGGHILEPWDNSSVGGHGNQLLSNR